MLHLSLLKKCTQCGVVYDDIAKNFGKNNATKDKFQPSCKKCKTIINDNYLSTEHGFMTNLFNSIRKKANNIRYKNLSDKEKDKHRCYVTKKEFFELWEDHKKKFGYHCRLSGIKMVCLKSKGRKGAKYLGYSNGVSVDRLDPNMGYTKNNIIFVANEVNKNKGAVTKDMCIKILKLYDEKENRKTNS